VETILGPLAWDETGAPTSDFLLAQWQNGAVEIVAPADAATVDTVVAKTPWQ
jgi:branched-chain amino acid transport system substrate-binding protein